MFIWLILIPRLGEIFYPTSSLAEAISDYMIEINKPLHVSYFYRCSRWQRWYIVLTPDPTSNYSSLCFAIMKVQIIWLYQNTHGHKCFD